MSDEPTIEPTEEQLPLFGTDEREQLVEILTDVRRFVGHAYLPLFDRLVQRLTEET